VRTAKILFISAAFNSYAAFPQKSKTPQDTDFLASQFYVFLKEVIRILYKVILYPCDHHFSVKGYLPEVKIDLFQELKKK
jgi:hypothetical protein